MHRLRTGDHSCSNWNIRKRVATRLGTLGKRVARSSWGIAKQVRRSSWGIGKRAARSNWGVPKQPTARSNDSLPISWQATFSSCINPCIARSNVSALLSPSFDRQAFPAVSNFVCYIVNCNGNWLFILRSNPYYTEMGTDFVRGRHIKDVIPFT